MKNIFLSLKILFTILALGIFMFGALLMSSAARSFAEAGVYCIGSVFFACFYLQVIWGDDE